MSTSARFAYDEIGCGDGEHMMAAAAYLPRASFVGFDLAAEAIARGAADAERAGAENVELLHRDVCDVRANAARWGRAEPRGVRLCSGARRVLLGFGGSAR